MKVTEKIVHKIVLNAVAVGYLTAVEFSNEDISIEDYIKIYSQISVRKNDISELVSIINKLEKEKGK